jgi:hypothetical protein
MRLTPFVEGSLTLRSEVTAFLGAFVRRIETGLLGSSRRRCNYVVTERGADVLRFRAGDWSTALNVGLNEVELALSAGRVRYRVWYWRWAAYAVLLGALIGLVLMTFLTMFDLPGYLREHPRSMIPGVSIGAHVGIAWGMAIFWGFVWPWILIAAHRRPLGRLMSQLVGEVDAAAQAAGGATRGSPPGARP